MKIIEAARLFVADVCPRANTTAAAYTTKLHHLAAFLQDCEKIDQSTIDQFKAYLLSRDTKQRGKGQVKGPLSIFTIRSILATTRHFLRWGADRAYFPPVELHNLKEPRPDPKAVEQITVDKLLAAAAITGEAWEQARNTALIYILRDTGGRVGAVARMDMDALDLQNGYATAPDKNDQLAWLWFNGPTIAAIHAWLKIRPSLHPRDYHLWTGRRGDGLSTNGIRHILCRLARAAGITGRCNPHSFRHAFARDAILAGADLGQVSELMGHKGIVVTHKYYARWHKKELQEFHKKFSPGRNLPDPG